MSMFFKDQGVRFTCRQKPLVKKSPTRPDPVDSKSTAYQFADAELADSADLDEEVLCRD
jgi:hypothetical protein